MSTNGPGRFSQGAAKGKLPPAGMVVLEEAVALTGANYEWRITLIRAKGQYLGRVEAPDAKTASSALSRNFKWTRRTARG